MKLNNFGNRCLHKVPRLSIGAMRLPRDVDTAVALVRHAIDSGLRYIDTSRGYGESEWIIGQALKDGYRKKVLLSTKWSPWIVKIDAGDVPTSDRVRRRIEESMRRLDVDFLDFYQVWNISSRENYDQAVAKGGMVDGMLKAKEEGLVGNLGFTTHDKVENLAVYFKEADWCDIVLMTYNMLNLGYAPAISAARKAGIGVVVMNPVGGGRLAEPSPLLEKLARKAAASSVPDLAVRYVLSNSEIDTMLIGISKPSDVDDAVAALQRGGLCDDVHSDIEGVLAPLRKKSAEFCTGCGYCMPCPTGINIPEVMSCVHDMQYWGWEKRARARYAKIKGSKADACTKCGKCEKLCTQHLEIMQNMAYARENLTEP